MRHRFQTTWIAACLIAVAGPATAQAQGKIGYIDSQRLIAEAPGADSARQAFEQDMARYREQLAPLQEELQQMIAEYEQQQAVMTPERRQAREEEIRAKQTEYQQMTQQLEQQAQARQQELMAPIMEKIERVLESIRTEQGYIMIFDAASSGLIAADPSLDLTAEVLRRLQALAASG